MSQREPMLNVPGSVLVMILIMSGVYALLSFLDNVSANQLGNLLAFFPHRYSGQTHTIFGGAWADITSFFTYMFVHASIGELVINCLLVLAFGTFIARRLGSFDFFCFSILCGMSGAGLYLVMNWGSPIPIIGFSAVIYGYMSATFLVVFSAYRSGQMPLLRENVQLVQLARPAEAFFNPRLLGLFALWIGSFLLLSYINVGGEDFSRVQWEPHLGGVLGGLLFLWALDKPLKVD